MSGSFVDETPDILFGKLTRYSFRGCEHFGQGRNRPRISLQLPVNLGVLECTVVAVLRASKLAMIMIDLLIEQRNAMEPSQVDRNCAIGLVAFISGRYERESMKWRQLKFVSFILKFC